MKEQTNTRTTARKASKKGAAKSAAVKARTKRETRKTVIAKKSAAARPVAKSSLSVRATAKATVTLAKGGKNQHVIPLGNGWIVKGEKTKVITAITDNKKQAVTIAMSIARSNRSGLFVHDKAGRMVESRSFADSGDKAKPPKTIVSRSRRR